MSGARVSVHELIGWGVDEYPARRLSEEDVAERMRCAQRHLAERGRYVSICALLEKETKDIQRLLDIAARRPDMGEEYEELEWGLGVVDLRCLLAFQRRLVLDLERPLSQLAVTQDDWPGLMDITFGARRSTEYRIACSRSDGDGIDVTLHSHNPDLQFRLAAKTTAGSCAPFFLYGGSPFLEVAELQGRWFLRDGYHRAYRLLRAGIFFVPAVVVRARTMDQLGATGPWFFGEEQLFSERPPQVVDFLNDGVVLRYDRAAFRKVIRVRIEESLQSVNEDGEVKGEER